VPPDVPLTAMNSPTMSPATVHILQFFDYRHLPERLQEVSRPFCELAQSVALGPANAETVVALRKLLEAKDAAVRAVLSK
jgi:hypothetical protein